MQTILKKLQGEIGGRKMDRVVPYHNYIVVTPNGDIVGFEEEDEGRKFIAGYYVGKVEEHSDDREVVYEDYSTDPLQATVDICTELGAYEGDCRIYDLDSFIEVIRKSGIFEVEKEEIISKLMNKKIDLNINDYQLDEFLTDTKQLPRSD